jgi:rhodanese-related sulfurtransferase
LTGSCRAERFRRSVNRLLQSVSGQVFILWAAALVPTVLACLYHPRLPDTNPQVLQKGEILLDTALAWGGAVLWVDARSAADYAADHVPGAVLLNEDQWDAQIEQLVTTWTPDQRVVVYCSSRACRASHKVAARLRDEMGLDPVYVLKNGWDAWRQR